MTSLPRTALVLAIVFGAVPAMIVAAPVADAAPPPAGGATPVPVAAGQTVDNIDVTLGTTAHKAQLSARFVSRSGRPLTGDRVRVFDRAGHQVGIGGVENGKFSHYLPAASTGYTLCLNGSGLAPQCLGHKVWNYRRPTPGSKYVRLRAGQHKSLGRVTVLPAAKITGVVRDNHGRAMRTDVWVRSISHPRFIGFGFVRDQSYKVNRLPPSKKGYVVCFEGSGYPVDNTPPNRNGYAGSCVGGKPWDGRKSSIPRTARSRHVDAVHVAPGGVKHSVNGRLTPGGSIVGKLFDKDTGEQISPGANFVSVFDRHGREVPSIGGGRLTYQLDDLLPGHSYRVCMNPIDYHKGHSYFGHCYGGSDWRPGEQPSGTWVHVRAGERRSGIDIRMSPAATITGRVSLAGGAADQQADVYLYSASGTRLARRHPTIEDHGATFTFGRLTPRAGGYVVCVRDEHVYAVPQDDAAPTCYGDVGWNGPGNPPPGDAEAVNVRSGRSTSGVDITMGTGGNIEGTVLAKDGGAPLATEISVFDAAGTLVASGENTTFGQVRSDGHFAFYGLPPSSDGYRLCFSGDGARSGANDPNEYRGVCYADAVWKH